MKKLTRTILTTFLLAGALTLMPRVLPAKEINKTNVKQASIVPENYTPHIFNCAKYITKIAREWFKKDFSPANAWNLKYGNRVAWKINESNDLEKLAKNYNLKPGMIVGVKSSDENTRVKDLKGKTPEYTQVFLYTGINEKGDLQFTRFDTPYTPEKITLSEFESKGLRPVEVIDTRN